MDYDWPGASDSGDDDGCDDDGDYVGFAVDVDAWTQALRPLQT